MTHIVSEQRNEDRTMIILISADLLENSRSSSVCAFELFLVLPQHFLAKRE